MEDNTEDNHIDMEEADWSWIEHVASEEKRVSITYFALWPRDLWKGSVFSRTSDTTYEIRFTAEDARDYAETLEKAWEFESLPEDALLRTNILRFLALCRLGSVTVHVKEEIEDEETRDWVC